MSGEQLCRKTVSHNPLLVGMLVLCLTAIVWIVQPSFSTVHAQSVVADPLVLVSVDKTPGSACTETFKANIGTPQQIMKRIPCAAWTLVSDVTMHRSQAIAQHAAYIVLPSTQNGRDRQLVLKQIQALHSSKQALLHAQLKHYALPNTACGSPGGAVLTWYEDGGTLNASIGFYKSSDCKQAYFTDSQLNTSRQVNDDFVWSYDQYAGNSYTVPGCPDVKSVGHHFHTVSQQAPVGYYYENEIYPGYACGQSPYNFWDNLGPIN